MSNQTIFEATDCQGDAVKVQVRASRPSKLRVFVINSAGVALSLTYLTYLTREQVSDLHAALGEWLANVAADTPEPVPGQIGALIRRVNVLTHDVDAATRRIDALERAASQPSPLHQAIADEIRRATRATQ